MLSSLVYDARRFVLSNKLIIEKAPLQLYSSAIIFSPSKSKVRSQFRHLIPPWITQVPEPKEDWTSELYALEDNNRSIKSLSFSPLDDLLASRTHQEIKIWDYVTGTELYKVEEFDGTYCVSFSLDGKTIASGMHNGVIKIREFAKGRSIDLVGHTGPVYSVAFSPKSSSILASISSDKTLRIWNIEKKEAAHILDVSLQYDPPSWSVLGDIEFPPRDISFSPQGDFVAVGSKANGRGSATLWGVEKGELRTTFEGHQSLVSAIAISADNETVISGSDDGIVKVWNAETGQTRHETSYDGRIQTIIFCPPNGEHVIIGVLYGIVEIREVDTWELVRNVSTESHADISLSRDGQFLAESGFNGTVRLYDMWRASSDVPHKDPINFLTFFPGKDNDVMTATSSLVQLWDVNNALIKSTSGHLGKVSFSPDERFVGLENMSGRVEIWSQRMARRIASYDQIGRLVFSPTSTHVAVQSLDITRIIDLTNLKETAAIDCRHFHPFAFSPDSRVVAWCDESERICLLDLPASKELVGPTCVSAANFTFSPDGELVVIMGIINDSRGISVLQVATGKEVAAFSTGYRYLVTFHPAGHLLAAGETDMSVWNTTSGGKIRTFRLDTFMLYGVTAVAFSAAADLVAAAGVARDHLYAIQLWDFASGTTISIFRIRTKLRHLSFSSDSRYLETLEERFQLPLPITGQAAALDDVSLEASESYLYIEDHWVVWGFDQMLWLPQEFRGIEPAVRGNTVAFGHPGGTVTYLKVDLAKIPRSSRSSRAKALHRAEWSAII